MKYAFMSFSTPDLGLAETLNLAARLGYDGIEPRIGHAHGIDADRTPEQRSAALRQARDAGVAIACLALGTQFANPEAAPDSIESVRRFITLAHDLDCPVLRVFGGKIPEGIHRADATAAVAAALSQLGDEAKEAGVAICLETHDAWTHPDDVAALMEQVAHPAIAVNWDFLHPTRISGVAVRAGFERLLPWIRHVHVHDALFSEPLVFRPFGEGDLDMRTAFQCLIESNYTGWVSGEWIDAEKIIDLGQELSRMKALESELRA